MADKSNDRIMEDFLLASACRPEVQDVASDTAQASQHAASMAYGLSVAARILGQVLWPELDQVDLAAKISDIAHNLQVRGLTS